MTKRFFKKNVYKKMRLTWLKSSENHKAQFPKLSVVVDQKSILHHHYIQNVQDGMQIGVYTINKESVARFSLFISVKVTKILENLRLSFGKS